MADCKITHGQNKGFWIAESFMQLTLYYIYNELEKPEFTFNNKLLFLEDIKFKIDGYANGYMTLGWGNHLNNSVDTQTMIQVLQSAKTVLQSKGISISVSELKNIPSEDYTFKYMLDKKPFPTAELIRVLDALIEMLQGTWTSENYNMDLNWRYNS